MAPGVKATDINNPALSSLATVSRHGTNEMGLLKEPGAYFPAELEHGMG